MRSLAALFLRLGATAFGGPAAHIAMMEDEVVRRRGWMSRAEFLDLVGATNLIPGPNSTELAIHIGFARARWAGLVVAGVCFIAPAMAIVWGLAWAYVRFGTLPAVAGMLAGVQPVVVAIVAQAIWRLGRTALSSAMTVAIFVAALLALALGVHELVVLGVAALVAVVDRRVTAGGDPWRGSSLGAAIAAGSASAPALATTTAVALGPLVLVFLKAGALLFGSGYVLYAFLQADLVERLGWLTETQLLDAIAVGQFSPGPVFTSATFIGYLLAGHVGAVAATVAIFLPAFAFVALSAPALARWRAHAGLRALLDGVNAASLALMVSVTVVLAREAFVGASPSLLGVSARVALSAASLWLLGARQVNASWLLLAGATGGLLLTVLR